MNHRYLKLRTPYQAPYGLSAEQAAEEAVKFAAKWMKATPRLTDMTFDFHGFYQPLDVNSDPAQLAAGIHERHKELAELYATAKVPADAVEREQGCQQNQALRDGVLPAIQCGQRWGEEALEAVTDYNRLRHVFVWDHIRVPFNPWAPDEHLRVATAVEDLLKNPTPQVLAQKQVNELVRGLGHVQLGLPQNLGSWILQFLTAYKPGKTACDLGRIQYEFHDHGYSSDSVVKTSQDPAFYKDPKNIASHLAGLFLTYMLEPGLTDSTELRLTAEFASTMP